MAQRSARTPKILVAAKLIDEHELSTITDVAQRYAVSITSAIQDRIFEADDPVRRQFVPTTLELTTTPEEADDPIGDDPFTPAKGAAHRYPDRVLFRPPHICPVYCRFCFRREVVGPGDQSSRTRLSKRRWTTSAPTRRSGRSSSPAGTP